MWVKLDDASISQYCHEIEGEAWSLAYGADDIAYLRHESEGLGEVTNVAGSTSDTFGEEGASKGFDFSNAKQTPVLSEFQTRTAEDPGWLSVVDNVFCLMCSYSEDCASRIHLKQKYDNYLFHLKRCVVLSLFSCRPSTSYCFKIT